MSSNSDKFAAVEIRPCGTQDGGAGLYARVGGKLLGEVFTDEKGQVCVRLARYVLANGMKPKFEAVAVSVVAEFSEFENAIREAVKKTYADLREKRQPPE